MLTSVPETLLSLVKAYSPTGSERQAVETLVCRMRALGFTRAFSDEAGNSIGVMGDGPRQVILLGHIDTVTGEIPVRVESEAGLPSLVGRGSVDAKGALAAVTDAVATTGLIPGWQLVVIGAVGEEGDSPGASYIAPLYHPFCTIIGEPSHWQRLTLGYKGSARAELTLRRSRSHSAGRSETACEAAIKVWEALGEWEAVFNAGRERAFDQVQSTLSGMDSGGDGFEEWARLRFGTRLPLDLPPEEWYPRLCHIPAIAATPGLTLEPLGFPLPAFQGEKNTPLVRAFLASIRHFGGQPGFNLKTGTSDINLVAPLWNCPAIAYGPGDSAQDHTPGEHLSLEEYRHAVNVLKMSLKRLSEATDVTTPLR
jgi:[amino group carrier protein]-lysine/ornithine hydrolase